MACQQSEWMTTFLRTALKSQDVSVEATELILFFFVKQPQTQTVDRRDVVAGRHNPVLATNVEAQRF